MHRKHVIVASLFLEVMLISYRCAGQVSRHGPTDLSAAAEGMFDTIFAESVEERQTLEDVEIDRHQERQIGSTALQSLLGQTRDQGIRIGQRGKDVQYIRTLVEYLRPLMKNADRYPTIQVYVAQTEEIDARAFPGGIVVVTSGLLNFAGSEAAIVGILAHELSHIDRGHQLRLARAAKLAGQHNSSHALLITKQFARPFRADDEAQADLDAAKWASELGYDPMEMADLFRRLASIHDENRGLPTFLRTHPYFLDRFKAVRAFVQRESREGKVGQFVGRENLRRREAHDPISPPGK